MPDESDYFRLYARDVGLNPAISGATNVQDALSAGGFPNLTGDGSPVANAIDPATAGVSTSYLDRTNGAIYLVVDAIGTPTWALIGGEISGAVDAQGVIIGEGQAFVGASVDVVSTQMTDIDAYNNSGNGIRWKTNGTDGQQRMIVRSGMPGSPKELEYDPDGSLTVPGSFFAGAVLQLIFDDGAGSIALGGPIGVNGATPPAKAAAPVLLSDVITILQDLGFCS